LQNSLSLRIKEKHFSSCFLRFRGKAESSWASKKLELIRFCRLCFVGHYLKQIGPIMADSQNNKTSDSCKGEHDRKRRSPDYEEEENVQEALTQECGSSEASNARCEEESSSRAIMDCPICLQNCVHPVELPCSHIFCFLCIKGVAMQSNGRCAICRSAIPHDVLTNPRLKDISQLYTIAASDKAYHWFYEARSGGKDTLSFKDEMMNFS